MSTYIDYARAGESGKASIAHATDARYATPAQRQARIADLEAQIVPMLAKGYLESVAMLQEEINALHART